MSLPMRECGLKRGMPERGYFVHSVTPHAGVWIETSKSIQPQPARLVTPHAGVWIETGAAADLLNANIVTPHAGVWIETAHCSGDVYKKFKSLPMRECGLKPVISHFPSAGVMSLPMRECGLKPFDWNNYNESCDLEDQIEAYHK